MQIIIGRDAKTSQLNVIIGQQTLRLGAPGSVPQTVSRQHCRITVTEGGNLCRGKSQGGQHHLYK